MKGGMGKGESGMAGGEFPWSASKHVVPDRGEEGKSGIVKGGARPDC